MTNCHFDEGHSVVDQNIPWNEGWRGRRKVDNLGIFDDDDDFSSSSHTSNSDSEACGDIAKNVDFKIQGKDALGYIWTPSYDGSEYSENDSVDSEELDKRSQDLVTAHSMGFNPIQQRIQRQLGDA